MKIPLPHVALVCLAIISSTASQAAAAITAYEGFSFTGNAALSGQDSPAPLTAWSGSATVDPAGLTYGALETTGLAARSAGGGRAFVGVGSTVDTGVQYLSFLVSNVGTAGLYSTLEFRVGTSADSNNRFVAGVSNNNTGSASEYMIQNTAGSTAAFFSRSGVVRDSGTHLIVIMVDYTPVGIGTDILSWWLDPAIGGAQPAVTAPTLTGNFEFSHIGIAKFGTTNTNALFDEIRLGTTWASVTPVPEVSSAALVLLGSLTAFRRRSQR